MMKYNMIMWALAASSCKAFSTFSRRSPSLIRSFATTTNSEEEEITPIAADDTSICNLEAEVLEKLKSPFLRVMRDRGFLHQCTGISNLDDKLMEEGATSAYLGFDATADSLHVGSLLQIMILRHWQKSGNRPVVLIGGATSKVGDPTGKDESRVLLTDEIIKKNTDGISQVFQKFLTFEGKDDENKSDTDAIMVNNDDWLGKLNYLDFLREYGTQFSINRMMSFESVKQRLTREAPFSFLEFNYMILQAYDFLELYRRYNAVLQLGGSDQWGNMVSGIELGRKCEGTQLFALTAPLITTSDGKKMGKTAGGAMWLNADRLSEYDYWQFWRNTSDEDVIRFLKLFTELPMDKINELEELTGADINSAKVVLADEATTLLHGKECLEKIHQTTQNMFAGAGESTKGLPRMILTGDDLEGGFGILDAFVQLKLATSKKEARRLIQGGGAKLEGDKINDERLKLTSEDFEGGRTEIILRAGKKRAGVVEFQQ